MKRLGVGLLALAFTFTAYAAQKSKTVDFGQSVRVGSTNLPAGSVEVSWTGTGSDAQLTFAPNGKNPITVPAQIIDEKNPETAISSINVNGVQYLQEVLLKDVTLVVRNAPTAAAHSGN
jgi:hypothetical protein